MAVAVVVMKMMVAVMKTMATRPMMTPMSDGPMVCLIQTV